MLRIHELAACIVLWTSAGGYQIRPEVPPGELVIETSPGAMVTLDGAEVGRVSSSGRFIARVIKAGDHTLRIQHPDKRPYLRKITVQSGKPILVRVTLADYTGHLEILTTPEAEVLVDGKPAGAADGVGRLVIRGLRVGNHSVRAGRGGYNSREQTIGISPDVTTTVTMELRPIETTAEGEAPLPPHFVIARNIDAHRGAAVMTLFRSDSLQLLTWTRDGDRSLKLWDPATGRELSSITLASRYQVRAVSPDLRLVLAASPWNEEAPVILDPRTGTEVRRLPRQNEAVDYAAFSPDASELAMVNRDGEFTVWNVQNGVRLRSWRAASDRLAWSPNGRWLASGTTEETVASGPVGKSIVIRDTSTGEEVRRIPTNQSWPKPLFSPNSRWLAIVDGHVALWDPATGQQSRTITPPSGLGFHTAWFTADSRFLAAAMGKAIQLWDISSGAEVKSWPSKAKTIAFSPDGKWMATGEEGPSVFTIWRRE